MNPLISLTSSALLLSAIASAQSPTLLERILGPSAGSRFGVSVDMTFYGDLNGDYRADMIVGAPDAQSGRGEVHLYLSPVNSGVAQVLTGPAGQTGFGAAVRFIGDVNDDNIPDILISSVGNFVQVRSGANRSLIRQHNGGDNFGRSITNLNDIDGDGAYDYLIGQHRYNGGRGRAIVYSGRTGGVLRIHNGDQADSGSNRGSQLGREVQGVGDLDRDGFGDYLLSAHTWDNPNAAGTDNGYVELYSGRTGSVIYRNNGNRDQSRYGESLGNVGDVDNDGVFDWGYTVRPADVSNRRVRIMSGGTGVLIESLLSPGLLGYGDFITGGDFNRDGRNDVFISATDIRSNPTMPSEVLVYNFATNPATILHRWVSGNAGTQRGRSVSVSALRGPGDDLDIAIGEPLFGGTNQRGRVTVWNIPGSPQSPSNAAMQGLSMGNRSSPSTSGNSRRPHSHIPPPLISGRSRSVTSGGWLPGTSVALVVGLPGTTPIPGAPGCFLYVNPVFIVAGSAAANSLGVATVPLPIPRGLEGAILNLNWLGVEPGNNPLGVATSNGIRIQVGG